MVFIIDRNELDTITLLTQLEQVIHMVPMDRTSSGKKSAEPSGAAAWELARMDLPKMNHRRRVAGKDMAFEVKRTLESTRPVGVSRLA